MSTKHHVLCKPDISEESSLGIAKGAFALQAAEPHAEQQGSDQPHQRLAADQPAAMLAGLPQALSAAAAEQALDEDGTLV